MGRILAEDGFCPSLMGIVFFLSTFPELQWIFGDGGVYFLFLWFIAFIFIYFEREPEEL